jgi:TonB family protein
MNRRRQFPGALLSLLLACGVRAADPRVVPPRVVDEPTWIYPLEAEHAGVREGQVTVILSIDETGHLTDFLIARWTHRAFAAAVAEGLPAFRFSPARVRSEPTPVRMPVTFYFQQRGAVVSLTGLEAFSERLAGFADRNRFALAVCPADRLDRPLVLVDVVSPRYPEEMLERGEAGSVTLDFFIDHEGKVRMPAADLGTHPSFARAAAAALVQWRFEPPTSGGQPVIVQAVQTFNFPAPARSDRGT